MQAVTMSTERTAIAEAVAVSSEESASQSAALAPVHATQIIADLTAHCTIRYFTYAQLFRSPMNVRTVGVNVDKPDAEMEQLAKLIETQGLLQNLIGYEEVVQGNVYTGLIGIVAGGRRLFAIGLLIERGLLPEDFAIPVLIVTESEAAQVSLAENTGRKDMHHADVVSAMMGFFQSGIAVADIALSFGVEEIIVRRRIRLANVAPELFALYRTDELSFDQMRAFALSDNHERQTAIFKQHGSDIPAWRIKKLLTEDQIASDSVLAKFVTVAAYEKAGGEVVRDLFSNEEQGYLTDVMLVESLAVARLQKKANKIAKLHAWVEVRVSFSDGDKAEFAQVRKHTRAMTDTEAQECADIEAEVEKNTAAIDTMEDEDSKRQELVDRNYALWKRQRAIDAALYGDHAGDVALAGAVVTINYEGKAVVIGGLIREEDKSKREKIEKPAKTENTTGAAVSGHSDRLTRVLTSHRTAALRAELIQRPDVALVVATHALVCKVFGSDGGITSKISLTIAALDEDVNGSKAQIALDAKRIELEALLPENFDQHALFDWMLEQPQQVIFDLLAYCTAQSCDATLIRETTKSASFVQLGKAVNLNMGNWWTPTAKTYFAHISKPVMMEVVKTAAKVELAVPMEKMKKVEAAAAAERAITGTGWVPALLQVQ